MTASTLSWCSNKGSFEFTFENFYWDFFTNNSFSVNNDKIKWITASLLQSNIIGSYIQTHSTWYNDSIIIIKKPITETLNEFISQNVEKIKINWYSFDSTNKNTIKCNKEEIKMQTINSELKWNLDDTFFTQAFFIYKEYIYIISFSSENDTERDTFASDMKNLKCKFIEK